jgi:hypothetical protein
MVAAMKKSFLSLAAVALIVGPSALTAATLFWTGADLVGDPSVSFPTEIPTVVGGTSIQFTGSENFQTRIEVPLLTAGALGPASPATMFSFQLNITRLSDDWDPHFVLSDGAYFVGVAISDDNGANRIEYEDKGTYAYRPKVGDNIYQSPDLKVGDAANLAVDFLLGPDATVVSVEWQGVSGGYSTTLLDRTRPLSFVFMTDNEANEQYQINSLSIAGPTAVPEPQLIALMSLGFVMMALSRRACRKNCNTG